MTPFIFIFIFFFKFKSRLNHSKSLSYVMLYSASRRLQHNTVVSRSSLEDEGTTEVVGYTPHSLNVRDGVSQVSNITEGTEFDRAASRF